MNITGSPITELIITNVVKLPISTLNKHQAINSKNLFWIDGILFFIVGYESEEITLREVDKGVLYLNSVCYADCPEFSENSSNGSYCCEVLDMTNFAVLEDIVKYVKGVE